MTRSRRFRPLLEELEQRLVLSTVLVSNTAELRAALGNPSDTTIQLAPGTYNTEADAGSTFAINHAVTLEAASGASAATVLIDGNGTDRVFDITGQINVEFDNVTIQHGNASVGEGGGIYSTGGSIIQLNNSIVTNNVSGQNGGGIAIVGVSGGTGNIGSLTLNNSVVENNQAQGSGGGGIYSFNAAVALNQSSVHDNTASGGGGGIDIGPDISTVLTLNQSTIDHNTSLFGNGGGILLQNANLNMIASTVSRNSAGMNGGGIDVEKNQPNTPTLDITNSTISDNTTNPSGGGTGGGINIGNAAVLNLTNVTITGNTAANGEAGGIFAGPDTSAHTLLNTIVAGNTATSDPTTDDLIGTFTSDGHNLIGVFDSSQATGFTNGVNGDQVGSPASPIDPLLAPLANNGGPTLTNALMPGSPAIDAGQDGVVATDQRGVSRPQGAHTDIGAYELSLLAIQGLSGTTTIGGYEYTALTNVPVATFTISGGATVPGAVNALTSPTTINALINWGDNTSPSTGVIIQSGSAYTVLGSHTYREHGKYTITITVSLNGAAASTDTRAVMDEELLPGQNTPGTTTQRLIAEFYRDILGRPVDARSLQFWGTALNNITQMLTVYFLAEGLSLNWSHVFASYLAALEVTEAIAIIGRFQPPAGNPLTVLRANYEELLDRPLDGRGEATFLLTLLAGYPDQLIVSMIAASNEYTGKVS